MSSRRPPAQKPRTDSGKTREQSTDATKDLTRPRLQSDASGRVVEYSAPEDVCPICKSDRYLSPNLRLLVSQCYHKLCESCIDRIFTLGPEPCPTCGQTLRKSSFSPQTFENLGVEKEVVIRKRVARCFNRRQEDFATLRDYNNYLEEVEGIVFNLVNGVDLAETEARMKRYESDNRDSIVTNSARAAREVDAQKRADVAQQQDRQARRTHIMQVENDIAREEQRLRTEAIEDLERSNVSARKVVSRQRALALRSRSSAFRDLDVEPRDDVAVGVSFAGLIDRSDNADSPFDDLLADLELFDDADYLIDNASVNPPGTAPIFPYAATVDNLAWIGGFRQSLVLVRDVQSAVAQLFVPAP